MRNLSSKIDKYNPAIIVVLQYACYWNCDMYIYKLNGCVCYKDISRLKRWTDTQRYREVSLWFPNILLQLFILE